MGSPVFRGERSGGEDAAGGRDNEDEIQSALQDDRAVDWVIMGGADAHDKKDTRHWTVRGFQDGQSRLTFHVFPGTDRATLYPNRGHRWKMTSEGGPSNGFNLGRCRRLDVSGEQEEQVSGGCASAGNGRLEQTAEWNNGGVMEGDGLVEQNARADERLDEANETR
ncbi:hypothetical protein F5887DRAFT_1082915 [Amanita rubescens]|nr:hypothetical protein F5887DRAFT_1082915 [Amanita rubescens]